MKRGLWLIGIMAAVSAAEGAGVYNEPFESAGSVGHAAFTLGAGSWSVSGNVFRAAFAGTEPFAIPDVVTLRPSSGMFTGNYTAAGIEVIGFKFRASNEPPSHIYLELSSGTSVYQRVLDVPPPNVWKTYMVPLDGVAGGGWTVKRGSAGQFEEALTRVDSLVVKIRRSGATARECRIDDFFVDGLPEASTGMEWRDGKVAWGWDALQPGAEYVIQGSPTPEGPWADRDVVPATNRQQQLEISLDQDHDSRFFRLRTP